MPQSADSNLGFLRAPLLLGGLIGALALGWVVSGKGLPGQDGAPASTANAASCGDSTRVTVAVAPAIYKPVAAALDKASADCVVVVPKRQTATDVAAAYAAGTPPDVWVADSTYWYSRSFLHHAPRLTVLADDVAHTPVLLVGGDRAAQYPTWGAAEASGWVSTPDPTTTAAATLAATAPLLEAAAQGRPLEEAQQVLVPFAQDYGGRRARGLDIVVAPKWLEPTSRRVQVATEQDLTAASDAHPFLRSVTPPTGSPVVRFSVAVADGQPPAVQKAAKDLVKALRSPDGTKALHAAGLRTGSDQAASNGETATEMPTPSEDTIAAVLDTWRAMSVPSQILAVVDVSGSMDFAAGPSTRMGLLADSASAGIGMLPRHARVGLWVFSVDRGPADQDWLALEPTERLDKLDHGRTQRYALEERIAQLPTLTDGGTGLYDTALAAYRRAVKDYRPGYSNSVVLLTDGANDDPGSLSLSQLTHRLQLLGDPSRPTRIVAVGVSDDADMPALRQIATATGGEAFQAVDPADIAGVFARALLGRQA